MKKAMVVWGVGIVFAARAMELREHTEELGRICVHSIEHIERVRDFVDAQTPVVFFDIDDTLVTPKGEVTATTGWAIGLRRYLTSEYHSLGMRSINSVVTHYVIYSLARMVPALVQSEVIELINELQEHGVAVVALTGRPLASAAVTYEHLKRVGVDLEKRASFCSGCIDLSCGELDFPALCNHNVIICNGNSKGLILKRLFKTSGFCPKKFIVVDDDRKFLESIEREFCASDEPVFTGLWYHSPRIKSVVFTADMVPSDLPAVIDDARKTPLFADGSSPH